MMEHKKDVFSTTFNDIDKNSNVDFFKYHKDNKNLEYFQNQILFLRG